MLSISSFWQVYDAVYRIVSICLYDFYEFNGIYTIFSLLFGIAGNGREQLTNTKDTLPLKDFNTQFSERLHA